MAMMHEQRQAEETHVHNNMMGTARHPLRRLALLLACVAIVSSALHFWPFQQSTAWHMLCPPNSTTAVWVLSLVGCTVWQRKLDLIAPLLPHVSVFAFLTVCLLSLAFARDAGRTLSYSAKSLLMLVGAYTLFGCAMYDARSIRTVYGVATIAVALSIVYCLALRYVLGSDTSGFHGNAHKYGTYVGTLAPLCGAYLLGHAGWKRIAGAALLVTGIISYRTIGAVVGTVAGMTVFSLVQPTWSTRGLAIAAVILGIGIALAPVARGGTGLQRDLHLTEEDGVNVRQRYIEWQAELNLLAERTATGAGAGCINDYRSTYYDRLPKVNTLAAFDQNGWLACGAETGVLGLVCFGWAALAYFRRAMAPLRHPGRPPASQKRALVRANVAGLVAAGTTNLFSSVHYNGVLIVLVLLLAFISRTHVLMAASSNATY